MEGEEVVVAVAVVEGMAAEVVAAVVADEEEASVRTSHGNITML